MKLYNTLSRKLQDFNPKAEVKIYTCGPTVYDYQHIGNYSGYIYWDVLVRLLSFQGHTVKRVMNITDVGHLVSDADEGEDKLEKGAKREGKTARQVADFYAADFIDSMHQLATVEPIYAKATDYIEQQIKMISTLLEKGYAYEENQAIYFDVSKVNGYGKLAGQELTEKEIGARPEVITDSSKRNAADFALWFFTKGRFSSHEMKWPSPWGDGFPGWHIECSAIVHTLLGEPIDINAGGVDHIGIHHPNEIAQTEAAFNKPLSKIWIHNNHMMVDGKKISKSLKNGYTLRDLQVKSYSPTDFKILVLQAHYRKQSNFTWGALEAANNRLLGWLSAISLRHQPSKSSLDGKLFNDSLAGIVKELENDLNTPAVLALIDEVISQLAAQGISSQYVPELEAWLESLNALLGLDLLAMSPNLTDEQKGLMQEREAARLSREWARSDELRLKLETQGIGLRDTDSGSIWRRVKSN